MSGKRVMVMQVPGKEGEEDRSADGSTRMTCRKDTCQGRKRKIELEASHKKHRPHIKVGKDAEEEERLLFKILTPLLVSDIPVPKPTHARAALSNELGLRFMSS